MRIWYVSVNRYSVVRWPLRGAVTRRGISGFRARRRRVIYYYYYYRILYGKIILHTNACSAYGLLLPHCEFGRVRNSSTLVRPISFTRARRRVTRSVRGTNGRTKRVKRINFIELYEGFFFITLGTSSSYFQRAYY